MTFNTDALLTRVRGHFSGALPARLGVAVSGGGDSVALLLLLYQMSKTANVDIFAATVDHGLRPEAPDEVAGVADLCQSLGIPHTALKWLGWDGAGNLQDQARRARYDLLTNWAKSQNISALAVGHTADDQAETVLMRLGRSAGVDGLSGMSPERTENGVSLIRPLLTCGRDELRDFLIEQGVTWVDDPSNEDERFDRIRARKVMTDLAPLGISAHALADVAENMSKARDALDWYSVQAAQDLAMVDAGCIVLDPQKFRALPEEIARRVLVAALNWVGGAEYPPRRRPLMEMLNKARTGPATATLNGCHMISHRSKIWICREFNAVRDMNVADNALWDGRWIMTGPWQKNFQVRALGQQGASSRMAKLPSSLPRIALEASPAVWSGDKLIAAPLADSGQEWHAELVRGSADFHALILSH